MKRQRTTRRNGGASFIDLMANAVEGFQRHKAAFEKNARKSASHVGEPAPNEDFLYDFMRLNVQYLNQLARLGSNYSVVAARALERIYDYVTPDDYDNDPPPQELAEKADRRVIVRIPVENTIDDDADFEVGCSEFQADSEHRLALKCEFQHPRRHRGTSIRFALEPDERLEVRLALRITKEMVANVAYVGTVAVTRLKKDDYDKERQKHAIVLRRVE